MAARCAMFAPSSLARRQPLCGNKLGKGTYSMPAVAKSHNGERVNAAKLPPGVSETSKKCSLVWNSRACMIGLIGTFTVELVRNKGILGILQIIVVEVGKGLRPSSLIAKKNFESSRDDFIPYNESAKP
ncbi:high-light-induced protein, chloroplastic-like [Panicum miliaceum]|uniref:High-light-induced protein, chloroplastic-like n=1 Tax=Panicum miliaceum TaxID=4540 RepID=A0A3L6Q8M1_PANMI|nr:high-light-induced protein, chloroplastic-like [Panicum miliaceum]